jgi:hypothetical protein
MILPDAPPASIQVRREQKVWRDEGDPGPLGPGSDIVARWRDDRWRPGGFPEPTAALVSERIFCVTFGDELYAMDPVTLEPSRDSTVPLLARLKLRLESWIGAAVGVLCVLAFVAVARIRRAWVSERVFGPRGERASDGSWDEARHIVSNGRLMRPSRLRWHGRGPPRHGAEVVLHAGVEEAGRKPTYRESERVDARIHAFAGTRSQLTQWLGTERLRARRVARAVLGIQLAILAAMVLSLLI